MRVLLVHSYYRHRGGECVSFECEADGLERQGVELVKFTRDSGALSKTEKLLLPLSQIWSPRSKRAISKLIEKHQPDIVHFHNIFPNISRSVYWAVAKFGLPMVQSLHNYRPICPSALLEREGKPCEECLVTSWQYPALKHRCYRDSSFATLPLVLANELHRRLGSDSLPRLYYVTASEFAKSRFVRAGWSSDRIFVKPNLIEVPSEVQTTSKTRRGAIFVGRLSREKGVDELLSAWTLVGGEERLTIVGSGPLADRVQAAAARDQRIRYLGSLELTGVFDEMRNAKLLALPSVCYETFGRTLAEALSVGTPVVTSKGGALEEIANASSGKSVNSGNSTELAEAIESVLNLNSSDYELLRREARDTYRRKYQYTAVNRELKNLYEEIISIENE